MCCSPAHVTSARTAKSRERWGGLWIAWLRTTTSPRARTRRDHLTRTHICRERGEGMRRGQHWGWALGAGVGEAKLLNIGNCASIGRLWVAVQQDLTVIYVLISMY